MYLKIPFNDASWEQLQNGIRKLKPTTQELIQMFTENPNADLETGDDGVFAALHDRIFDSNTIQPLFYLIFPYLADIASRCTFKQAYHIWSWLGSYLSEGVQADVDTIPPYVMKVYQNWLTWSERECLMLICLYNPNVNWDIRYLLGAPFAFVRPEFGCISTMYDIVDYTAVCPNGHIGDYLLSKGGMVNKKQQIAAHKNHLYERLNIQIVQMPFLPYNSWKKLKQTIHDSGGDETETILAENICEKGICSDTPMPIILFLYAYLLKYIGKDPEFAQVVLRLLGYGVCPECGQEFIFAEGWTDYLSLIK